MNLAQIRQQIDEIDKDLLTLILKRFEYSKVIAKIKLDKGLQIYDESREQTILDTIKDDSGEEFRYVLPIFLEILNSSKLIQQKVQSKGREG